MSDIFPDIMVMYRDAQTNHRLRDRQTDRQTNRQKSNASGH